MWDVEEDDFDSMNIENAELLEIADIYVDEPEFELVLFDSERNATI